MKFLKKCLFTAILWASSPLMSSDPGQQSQVPVLTADELAEKTMAAQLILDRIKSAIAFYSAANQQTIRTKGGKVNDLLNAIEKLQADIKKVKDANNITALEQGIAALKDQIKNLAVNIYAKAVDPKDHTLNYFQQMNSILHQVYNDNFITDKLNTILSLQGQIASYLQDKMCSQGKCVQALRDLGSKAAAATAEEQKGVNQLSSQLLPMQAQLIGAKMQKKAYDELTPKEKDLDKLNNDLNDSLVSQMNESERSSIRRNNNAAKQLTQIFNFIENPNQAATITSDQIMSFDQNPEQ